MQFFSNNFRHHRYRDSASNTVLYDRLTSTIMTMAAYHW